MRVRGRYDKTSSLFLPDGHDYSVPLWSEWQEGTVIEGSLEGESVVVLWDHDQENEWQYDRVDDCDDAPWWEEINEADQPDWKFESID